MNKPNYKRMMQVIDDVFETRNDPDQLQVNSKQLLKLEKIHPATLTELTNEDGPFIWVLLIPTTTLVMNAFIAGTISEREVLEKTQPGECYDCIYLCSVTTLPEYRGKGDTKRLCLKGIERIRKDHLISTFFVWAFTKEGEFLAQSLADECKIELKKR